ncbi:MAG: prephenate dehydrogenase/arogenate dehydrogenase family protein [Burkholderiales bacterium]|nr:prephenate dehydrogenase/arogenate dehydrogenase family protein [Burkholderiales bacterium]
MAKIGKLAVVGVGLIGGSFALAARRANAVGRVVGVGRSRANIDRARALGVIDADADAAEAVRDAELVFLAMPVGQTAAVLAEIAPHLGPETVVTDAGSTKSDVVAAARAALGAAVARFVPGHPIAGAEHSGVAAARADLFDGKRTVLTPLAETDAAAAARVRELWRACGADVREMTPEVHDRIFAAVSHLPHLLAYALVHDVASHASAQELFDYAASGFRDFTRIASSHPEMWRDICIANRAALLGELDRYEEVLREVRALLDSGDAAGLERLFDGARAARNRWLERR